MYIVSFLTVFELIYLLYYGLSNLLIGARFLWSDLDDWVPHSLSVTTSWTKHGSRKCPWKPEVTDFDLAFFIDQNVGWFHIPVNNVSRVDVLHGAKKVINDQFNVLFWHLQLLTMLHELSQISLLLLHHQEYRWWCLLPFKILIDRDQINQNWDKLAYPISWCWMNLLHNLNLS